MTTSEPDRRDAATEHESTELRPVSLRLDKRDGLFIEWADGTRTHCSLVHLRRHCPCAACRQAQQETPASQSPLSLTVLPRNIEHATEFTDAALVGNYALRITWADGHNTGIYDFRYLRTLPSEPAR